MQNASISGAGGVPSRASSMDLRKRSGVTFARFSSISP
jgi:hypothetical protein